MKLAIYGAGGLGREAKEYADLQNEQEEKWSEIFFLMMGLTKASFLEHAWFTGIPSSNRIISMKPKLY